MARKLTAADVCEVTGYSRNELHALLKGLEPFASDRPGSRIARAFTPVDLLTLCVTQALEHRYGLRRTSVWEIGHLLGDVLARPRGVARHSKLVISIEPPTVDYRDDSSDDSDGIVVSLGPIFDRIDGHLSFGGQLSLQLGPGLVHSRKLA
jgi:hypothetical protein